MTDKPAGPLDGVKVLDLCSYLAGPYGCTLLADFGADVIKIESPQGDMLRQFPSSLAGESRFFLGTNRGKRALALDLKAPEGLAVLHRMVASADVLVENFRPSVPARLGIDYPRLRAINPRLIYAGLTGYGDTGPLSEKGGFDQVLQCLSGMAVFQGGGADRPQLVLGSVLDYFTSALLAYGVAAALFQRERSGAGQYLSLSLLRSALDDTGRPLCVGGERGPRCRTRFRHRRADRHPSDKEWRALCLAALQPFLRCVLRADRPPGAGERSALRDDAQPRRACRRIAAGSARRSRRAHRAGMGGDFRRTRAVRGGAADRGDVRPSAGGCRGAGDDTRPSGGRPLSNDDEADQILGHAGAGADRGADIWTAQRRGAVGIWLLGCRDCGVAGARRRALNWPMEHCSTTSFNTCAMAKSHIQLQL